MISILIERTATEGFCPVGHDGGGVMVDNVLVFAMVRRDNIMTEPIDVAVTVEFRWAGDLT